jgi:hypothetical protein
MKLLNIDSNADADKITERTDAVLAAQRRARTNGRGYAFAVQWPNHWSVEDRKPSLRAMVNGRPAQVIECREDGSHVIA